MNYIFTTEKIKYRNVHVLLYKHELHLNFEYTKLLIYYALNVKLQAVLMYI